MGDLVVELYGHPVGRLQGADYRSFDFVVDSRAFDHFGIGSNVLSESVPLNAVSVRARAERRRNFFHELLPEGDSLTELARIARVDSNDTIGMLSAYGRDIAGAIQIWDPEKPGEPKTPHTAMLSEAEIEALLLDRSARPLGNQPAEGKSSLAGVQPKAVLALIDGQWHQAMDGYPSTHIVKPELERRPESIFDEEYGSRFARALDLARFRTSVAEFKSVSALVIERYDRTPDNSTGRIHQEDMNQALGVRGDSKYQELGDGSMSLARIARIFAIQGDRDSLTRLLRNNVLAVGVGNLDMHGKNLSIMHFPDDNSTLAPSYDIVPAAHRSDVDGRMSLAINGEYQHSLITRDDLNAEAAAWGMRDSGDIVDATLAAMLSTVEQEQPDPRAWSGLQADIHGFVTNLISGKAAGEPDSRKRTS